MERLSPQKEEELRKLHIIAAAEFGPDALFTYVKESENKVATLTLSEAISICGHSIASEGIDTVMVTLRRMHDTAVFVEKNKPELFEQSKKIGQEILNRYVTRPQ